MHYFVRPDSVVRRIWGDADVILLIFAGSAAEFALNKAVDWLFFTGRLPADPIARLFSTVRYAQEIVFAPDDRARQAIGRMHTIHKGVEQNRGYSIPDWAYRDVLYMLIDYSERAYQLLHRPLTDPEREELFTTFRAVGAGMGVPDLPVTYADWQVDRRSTWTMICYEAITPTGSFNGITNSSARGATTCFGACSRFWCRSRSGARWHLPPTRFCRTASVCINC